MDNIIPLKPKAATDHKWRNVPAEEGKMAFEYHSAAEQRIKDLENGQAEITPDEQDAIRKLFMDRAGIKDVDKINEAVAKDNERIRKKLENKNIF